MFFIAKTLILLSFNLMALGTELFTCDDLERIKELDKGYDMCFFEKWSPLPPYNPNGEMVNERQCCYFQNRECQFNKLTRDKCKINDEKGFSEMVAIRTKGVAKKCKKIGVNLSESFCKTLKTNPVDDPLCKQFIFCSMETMKTGVAVNEMVDTSTRYSVKTGKPVITDSAVEDTTPSNVANTKTLFSKLLSFTTILYLILIYT